MGNEEAHCSVCGYRGEFVKEPGRPARDTFRCGNCRSMQRQRDVAQIIVDEFGHGQSLDLNALARSGDMDDVTVYEVGMVGPIGARLKSLPHYTRSYLWDDVPLGEQRNGIDCQDLRSLTYADESFDLILSLEVLEHVFEGETVLREIRRVLKPGGLHVFSVPVRYPFEDKSEIRAEISDGEIRHLMEPRYHVAGDGSKSLVVTEWGRDLFGLHERAGLRLSAVRRSAPLVSAIPNATFVARRLG